MLSSATGCLGGIHQLGTPPGVGGPVLREWTGEGAELLAARLDGAVNWPLYRPGSKLLRLGDVTGDAGICRRQLAPSALTMTPPPQIRATHPHDDHSPL